VQISKKDLQLQQQQASAQLKAKLIASQAALPQGLTAEQRNI